MVAGVTLLSSTAGNHAEGTLIKSSFDKDRTMALVDISLSPAIVDIWHFDLNRPPIRSGGMGYSRARDFKGKC